MSMYQVQLTTQADDVQTPDHANTQILPLGWQIAVEGWPHLHWHALTQQQSESGVSCYSAVQ